MGKLLGGYGVYFGWNLLLIMVLRLECTCQLHVQVQYIPYPMDMVLLCILLLWLGYEVLAVTCDMLPISFRITSLAPVPVKQSGRMWVTLINTKPQQNTTTSKPCAYLFRDQSRYAPNQWEMTLQCNDVSHWLGAYLDWSLFIGMYCACRYCCMAL